MLDVHPPHEPVHGPRDFLLHILTITIGLLIALGLEGLVEWQHHRHLVHEAEAALHREIEENARGLDQTIAELRRDQDELKQDMDVLRFIAQHHKAPPKAELGVNFTIRNFRSVNWRTAEATGAIAYMPYAVTQQYAEIYQTQDELNAVEQQAARDTIVALGPMANATDTQDPTGGQAQSMEDKVEVVQGQLLLVNSLLQDLNGQYRAFLQGHSE